MSCGFLSRLSREREHASSADRSGHVLARRLRHAAAADHELRAELPVVLGLDLVLDGPPCFGIGTQRAEHPLPFHIGIARWCCVIGKAAFCDSRTIGILTKSVPRDRATLRRRRACASRERCAKTEQDENVSIHAEPVVRYTTQIRVENLHRDAYPGLKGKRRRRHGRKEIRALDSLCENSASGFVTCSELHRTTTGARLGCDFAPESLIIFTIATN